MTFEVQQTRWDRIIRRVSGSIGPGSRVSETLSELFPVIDVEQVPAELLLLGGTRMAMGRSSNTPLAANFQLSMLRNPGGSEAIITLLGVAINGSGLSGFALGMTLNTFPNLNTANTGFRDGRLIGTGVPVGEVRDDQSLVIGVEHFVLDEDQVNGGLFQPPKALAVISPGTAFSVSTRIVNTSLLCSWLWIERPAEQSELSL